MITTIKFPNGKSQKLDFSCKRVGILKSKTNGMYDLVVMKDSIIKWMGKNTFSR